LVTKESKSDRLDKHISILSDEELREKYNSALKERLDDNDYDNDDYDQFNEYVKQAGAATKTYAKKKCPGWFQFSRAELSPLLENLNII
jgi:oligoendopeptidase F